MNNEVKAILDTIMLDEKAIPNALLHFDGESDTFILYSPSNESIALAGDDIPLALVEGWDIDVYSKNNYIELSKAIKKAFIYAGWVYRGSGVDTYDEATKLYHRLMEFSKEGDTSFITEGA